MTYTSMVSVVPCEGPIAQEFCVDAVLQPVIRHFHLCEREVAELLFYLEGCQQDLGRRRGTNASGCLWGRWGRKRVLQLLHALLALGCWALLCALDLSTAWWPSAADGEDAEVLGRPESHGIALGVLALASLVLTGGQLWPFVIGDDKSRSPVGILKIVWWDFATHGILTGGSIAWVIFHSCEGRWTQAWVGLTSSCGLFCIALLQFAGTFWGDVAVLARAEPVKHLKPDGVAVTIPRSAEAAACGKDDAGKITTGSSEQKEEKLPEKDEGHQGSKERAESPALSDLSETSVWSGKHKWKPLFKDPTFNNTVSLIDFVSKPKPADARASRPRPSLKQSASGNHELAIPNRTLEKKDSKVSFSDERDIPVWQPPETKGASEDDWDRIKAPHQSTSSSGSGLTDSSEELPKLPGRLEDTGDDGSCLSDVSDEAEPKVSPSPSPPSSMPAFLASAASRPSGLANEDDAKSVHSSFSDVSSVASPKGQAPLKKKSTKKPEAVLLVPLVTIKAFSPVVPQSIVQKPQRSEKRGVTNVSDGSALSDVSGAAKE